MQIKLTLDINYDNNTLSVSGDSKGIYDLTDEIYKNSILIDAIKSKSEPMEEAILKINYPELHEVVYAEKYYTEEYKQQKIDFKEFMKGL